MPLNKYLFTVAGTVKPIHLWVFGRMPKLPSTACESNQESGVMETMRDTTNKNMITYSIERMVKVYQINTVCSDFINKTMSLDRNKNQMLRVEHLIFIK